MEARAFDGHVLGRAKIDRIRVVFISDGNAALANLLAGEAHLSADTSIRLEHVATLKREWGPRNLGSVIQHPNQWRAAHFQLRPEVVGHRGLLDVRVRQALAHTVDKKALDEAVNLGDGIYADSMVPPRSEFGPGADRVAAKYAFDPRRAEQLMTEAGYSRVGGFYTSPTEGRFAADLKTNAATDNEQEIAIMSATWRENGFEVQESVLPAAQAQNNQVRATYPGMFANNTGIGEAALLGQTSSAIPRAENRWSGANRGGWSNPEFDRLAQSLNTTLDRTERAQQAAQMVKLYTEDVGSISLFFRTQPWAHVAALRGPMLVAPESNVAWNVHEWELR
jgi:peptide/nickel transport system substrate-binding protein